MKPFNLEAALNGAPWGHKGDAISATERATRWKPVGYARPERDCQGHRMVVAQDERGYFTEFREDYLFMLPKKTTVYANVYKAFDPPFVMFGSPQKDKKQCEKNAAVHPKTFIKTISFEIDEE